jgi:hypothetical protein
MSAPLFDQKCFRWYADDHVLGVGENPLAGENVDPSVAAGVNYRLRIEVANTGTSGNVAARLEFKEGSGAWTALGASGATRVFYSDSTYFSDGAATSDSLLTANGTYSAGQAKDAGATASSLSLASGHYGEWVWNIRFAATAAGKTYQFRVTDAGSPLDSYTVTPQVTVPSSGTFRRRNLSPRTGCRGVMP